jgi:hypothetical protein
MCVPLPLHFLTPIDIRGIRGEPCRFSHLLFYPARATFRKKKKLYLLILHIRRPGVNRNLRKCVLGRVNSGNRRDRVMGCIRFIPRMTLFLR